MASSASKGFPYALQSQAIKLFGDGKNAQLADSAITLMEKAAAYSDEAKIWLAERYRLTNQDKSFKWALAITDTLNPYRIMREIDMNLLTQTAERRENGRTLSEFYDLLAKLNSTINLYDDIIFNPRQLAAVFSYLTLGYPQGKQMDGYKEICLTLSNLLGGQIEQNFIALRFHKMKSELIEILHALDENKLNLDISPWLRSNIEFELETDLINLYPVTARDDISNDIPLYTIDTSKFFIR